MTKKKNPFQSKSYTFIHYHLTVLDCFFIFWGKVQPHLKSSTTQSVIKTLRFTNKYKLIEIWGPSGGRFRVYIFQTQRDKSSL